MRPLPEEEVSRPPKNKQSYRKKPSNSKLAEYEVGLKKITLRLERYAKSDLSDGEILALLNDTRSQVLSLHIARQKLKNQPKTQQHKNKKPRNRNRK